MRWTLLLAALGLVACHKPSPPLPPDPQVGPRTYDVRVPKNYADAPVPLLVALHPLDGAGPAFVKWWGLEALADEKTFLLVAPNGTSVGGNRFWNATDGCCDFSKTGVDDVTYLKTILDEVTTKYKVDPKRIYLAGFSNGGFMSHRMACEDSRVAAIVSLAGAQWKDETKCKPPGLVSVLEAHGTADKVVRYEGGGPIRQGGAKYPSAAETVATWAKKDGCTGALAPTGESRHFLATASGNETHLARYEGCPAGIDVELWTIDGAPHVAELTPAWGAAAWDFLAAHPKP